MSVYISYSSKTIDGLEILCLLVSCHQSQFTLQFSEVSVTVLFLLFFVLILDGAVESKYIS